MEYIIFCESQTNMDLFADERYIPEWESFFSGVLAQRINDTSFNHISVLKKDFRYTIEIMNTFYILLNFFINIIIIMKLLYDFYPLKSLININLDKFLESIISTFIR